MPLACPPEPSRLRFRNMRIRSVLTASLSVLLLAIGVPARAVTPPSEFGSDYDDPRTPAPAVAPPDTQHSEVQVVPHPLRNLDPDQSTDTPPAGSPGPRAKVVLR